MFRVIPASMDGLGQCQQGGQMCEMGSFQNGLDFG